MRPKSQSACRTLLCTNRCTAPCRSQTTLWEQHTPCAPDFSLSTVLTRKHTWPCMLFSTRSASLQAPVQTRCWPLSSALPKQLQGRKRLTTPQCIPRWSQKPGAPGTQCLHGGDAVWSKSDPRTGAFSSTGSEIRWLIQRQSGMGCNSQRSMMWFRQIAQLSTTMSHAHSATCSRSQIGRNKPHSIARSGPLRPPHALPPPISPAPFAQGLVKERTQAAPVGWQAWQASGPHGQPRGPST